MAQGDSRRSQALRAVGAQIRQYRQERGLSITELARRTGLHRTFIGHLERGVHDPSVLHLWRIAQALQVPLTALVQPLNWIPPEDQE